MIPAPFTYHRPKTLGAALRLLQTLGSVARVLAGGQSLLPMMKLRLAAPAHLIDIGRIAALRRIRAGGGRLRIGALATHSMIESVPAVRRWVPVLAETASTIGDLQVRNLGTMGGAAVHADPAADYPATLLALDAEFVLQGPDGARIVPASEFFQGLMATALRPDELLIEISLPTAQRVGAAYMKMPNPASGFALAGVAASVALDGDGRCRHVRVGITGVASAAYRARHVEQALLGQEPTDEVLAAASAAAADGVDASADLHASAEYRRHLARVLTRRALAAARDRRRSGKQGLPSS
ncbi:MAG: xanthine dehydrogenase family protein subunit M [Armatimonadetes bacterium]|nr:xanthine dehydrogenase family protein subunit M [Armatimonadota bacterium]